MCLPTPPLVLTNFCHLLPPSQVSLLNAPLIRMSFSVSIASDHVRLADDKNRFKVVLPDQLLESVFSGYYEVGEV